MAEPVAHAYTSIATFCRTMWRNPDLEEFFASFTDPWERTDACNPDFLVQA